MNFFILSNFHLSCPLSHAGLFFFSTLAPLKMGFNTACRTQRGPQHCKAETPKPTTHKRVAAVSPCKSPPTPAAPTKTSTNVVLGKTSQPAHEKRKLSITLSSRVIVVGASTSQDRTQPAQKRPKVSRNRPPPPPPLAPRG